MCELCDIYVKTQQVKLCIDEALFTVACPVQPCSQSIARHCTLYAYNNTNVFFGCGIDNVANIGRHVMTDYSALLWSFSWAHI